MNLIEITNKYSRLTRDYCIGSEGQIDLHHNRSYMSWISNEFTRANRLFIAFLSDDGYSTNQLSVTQSGVLQIALAEANRSIDLAIQNNLDYRANDACQHAHAAKGVIDILASLVRTSEYEWDERLARELDMDPIQQKINIATNCSFWHRIRNANRLIEAKIRIQAVLERAGFSSAEESSPLPPLSPLPPRY